MKFKKLLICMLSLSVLIGGSFSNTNLGMKEAHAATKWTEKKGTKTYSCTPKYYSASQVKTIAKKDGGINSWIIQNAIMPSLELLTIPWIGGWLINLVYNSVSNDVSEWQAAAKYNKKAKVVTCGLKSPKYNGYNGPVTYSYTKFY